MKHIIFLFMVLITQFKAYSTEDNQVDIVLSKYREEKPEKGHRIPPHKEICTIDFIALTIQTSVPEFVISYQVWNETGQSMISSYSNDYDMVTFITTLSGIHQIRLDTGNNIFIGLIDL